MGFFDFATYQWTKGQKNWHLPYNNALQALKDFLGDKGANASLAAYTGAVETDKNTVKTEVQNAREGNATLLANMQAKSARVDVEHNADGTHMASASSATDFKNSGDTPTYISTTQFSVTGDKTAIYVAGRRIKATLASGAVYGTVSGSAYGSVTTVTIKESVLDNTISAIAYGLISPGAAGSVPAHTHVDDKQGGAIPEIAVNTNNIFRLADEMQIQHGGFIGFQNGWADGFEVDDQQGCDRTNSTGEDRDISGADKFMKGTDPGTGLNADQDYTAEGNYEFHSDTGTNNATVATNTVTLSSGTWPTNCAGARFKIGANEGKIASRDSSTQITLVAGHSVSGTNASWTIYYHEFASGVAKLSTATVAGGYGSDVTGGQTYSDGGAGTADNPPANAFDNDETTTNWRRMAVTDTDTTWVAVQFGAAKTITKIRVKPRGADGGSSSSVKNWVLYGSNSAAGTGGTNLASGTAANTVDVYFEATFSNSTAYTYYTFAITSDYLAGSHNRSVWEIEMMEGGSTTVNVINEYVPVIPAYANLADSSAFSDINSLARTETLNSANVWYLAFVNAQSGWGANTELGVWNGTPVYRRVVQNVAGTWKFNSNATFTSETLTAAAVNTLAGAIREALTVAANQMTGATMAAVTDAALTIPTGKAGIVAILYSTVNSNNPQVDQTRVNYDSQRAAMDLRSKAYDPGFSPTECYLSARIEHSDADGVGAFHVTRNGGTNWEAMTEIVQQGLPLTGNIRLFRGTHIFTTGAAGQDVRCRYVTAQNKNQYVRHWGLLTK